MQDKPDAAAIVATVNAFLRETILPLLSGRAAFDLRVSMNALELVGRELVLSPASDAAEAARLSALLGETGTLEDLNQTLGQRIAAGEIGLETPGLIDHLRATAIEKLAVDQPKYSSYRRALGKK
ncbi:hypothetical protein D3874_19540 [Oleomonas cavernae]|uniref:DUF6285 domain-containing protein n=1 Tax=Oleomonas cavernae TaxID=2320859 RepID=A0A418WG58_9PROT|nr:DUF6285 domain-containing protein [Oleomonas cavernae]RJF88899.1 hypothetical protein D3874_19540 [Oleomonas cavernae]